MTIEIKNTWFEENWNKPKVIKQQMKRYAAKTNALGLIFQTSARFGFIIPDTFKKELQTKMSFYARQRRKLFDFNILQKKGYITEINKTEVINGIINGKYSHEFR